MRTAIARLALGSGAFSVNAYLIETDRGFVLVDTGMRSHRATLEKRLAEAGCTPGALSLILITHGDADHIGNAAYLRSTFAAPIAMNHGDVGMTSKGDIFAGRQRPGWFARTILPIFARVREEDRFEPDVLVDEDSNLADYGLPEARVLLLRGHSSGSIALLLADGSLVCGDVLENRSKPRLGSIMDDVSQAQASVDRLRTMSVTTVYPGHGTPFEMDDVTQAAPDSSEATRG